MPKCSYCNKDDAENQMTLRTWVGSRQENALFYYCSESCKNAIEEFSIYVNNNVKRFLYLILIVILAFIIFPLLAFVFKEKQILFLGFSIPIFILGIVIRKYPFATPETSNKWGLKRSITVMKYIGIVLITLGILVIVFNLALLFL